MNARQIGKAGDTLSQATARIAQAGLHALVDCGERDRGAAVVVVLGAVTGALQVLASVIGNSSGGKTSAQSVTDDAVLFAALLTVCSQSVHHPDGKPDIVAVQIDHDHSCYFKAMDMFQKLTGRPSDSVIEPDLLSAARQSAQPGNELLNRVCANHKPA